MKNSSHAKFEETRMKGSSNNRFKPKNFIWTGPTVDELRFHQKMAIGFRAVFEPHENNKTQLSVLKNSSFFSFWLKSGLTQFLHEKPPQWYKISTRVRDLLSELGFRAHETSRNTKKHRNLFEILRVPQLFGLSHGWLQSKKTNVKDS